jgi:hypothetical protein
LSAKQKRSIQTPVEIQLGIIAVSGERHRRGPGKGWTKAMKTPLGLQAGSIRMIGLAVELQLGAISVIVFVLEMPIRIGF